MYSLYSYGVSNASKTHYRSDILVLPSPSATDAVVCVEHLRDKPAPKQFVCAFGLLNETVIKLPRCFEVPERVSTFEGLASWQINSSPIRKLAWLRGIHALVTGGETATETQE